MRDQDVKPCSAGNLLSAEHIIYYGCLSVAIGKSE